MQKSCWTRRDINTDVVPVYHVFMWGETGPLKTPVFSWICTAILVGNNS